MAYYFRDLSINNQGYKMENLFSNHISLDKSEKLTLRNTIEK